MRLRIKSYSPCRIPGCEQFPEIHVVGETLPGVIPGRPRRMHGTVSMIADGSVRWNLVSSAILALCALAERMSDCAHLAVLYGGGRGHGRVGLGRHSGRGRGVRDGHTRDVDRCATRADGSSRCVPCDRIIDCQSLIVAFIQDRAGRGRSPELASEAACSQRCAMSPMFCFILYHMFRISECHSALARYYSMSISCSGSMPCATACEGKYVYCGGNWPEVRLSL